MLLGCARRRARTGEGAEDAVQQALTIALAIRERIRPRTAVAYIAVIAQHEASRLRRLSDGLVSLDQPVASGQAIGHDALPDDRHADRDAVIDALSALRRDKPDHARALIARALGWRYREICDAFEWTYTKTNRCVTEGGAELRRRDGTQA